MRAIFRALGYTMLGLLLVAVGFAVITFGAIAVYGVGAVRSDLFGLLMGAYLVLGVGTVLGQAFWRARNQGGD